MKRFLILLLKIGGGLLATVLVILVAAALMLNRPSVQNKVLAYAVEQLQTKLHTKVKIDSVRINFLTFDVNLMGLDVEDRQQRKMLQADKLSVNLDLWQLLQKNWR
jgi:autotransporter translocation and assembly factor TamB